MRRSKRRARSSSHSVEILFTVDHLVGICDYFCKSDFLACLYINRRWNFLLKGNSFKRFRKDLDLLALPLWVREMKPKITITEMQCSDTHIFLYDEKQKTLHIFKLKEEDSNVGFVYEIDWNIPFSPSYLIGVCCCSVLMRCNEPFPVIELRSIVKGVKSLVVIKSFSVMDPYSYRMWGLGNSYVACFAELGSPPAPTHFLEIYSVQGELQHTVQVQATWMNGSNTFYCLQTCVFLGQNNGKCLIFDLEGKLLLTCLELWYPASAEYFGCAYTSAAFDSFWLIYGCKRFKSINFTHVNLATKKVTEDLQIHMSSSPHLRDFCISSKYGFLRWKPRTLTSIAIWKWQLPPIC